MRGLFKSFWVRGLIGGFVAELLLIVVAVPFFATGNEAALTWVIPPACFLLCLGAGYVAGRGASRPLAAGAVVGLFAALSYLALTSLSGEPLPIAYHVGNGLKVAGGLAGGWLASRGAAAAKAS
jgi:hypothetical protein